MDGNAQVVIKQESPDPFIKQEEPDSLIKQEPDLYNSGERNAYAFVKHEESDITNAGETQTRPFVTSRFTFGESDFDTPLSQRM